MATRSRIAIENLDGTIESIYCHFDGYKSGVGEVLKTFYTDVDKIRELLSLGDLSSLDVTLDHTVAYSRDRGEDYNHNKAKVSSSIYSFKDLKEEYNYIFSLKDNKWRGIR